MSDWSVYILLCADQTLYTGISNDVEKRFKTHESGQGQSAKYTRSRRPLKLLYQVQVGNRSKASQLEYRIKKLSRPKKLDLIEERLQWQDLLDS